MRYLAVHQVHLPGDTYALLDLRPSQAAATGPLVLCSGPSGKTIRALAVLLNERPDTLDDLRGSLT